MPLDGQAPDDALIRLCAELIATNAKYHAIAQTERFDDMLAGAAEVARLTALIEGIRPRTRGGVLVKARAAFALLGAAADAPPAGIEDQLARSLVRDLVAFKAGRPRLRATSGSTKLSRARLNGSTRAAATPAITSL